MKLTGNLKEDIKTVKTLLPIDKSFDVVGRNLVIGSTDAYMLFIDGFVKDEVMLRIIEDLQKLNKSESGIYGLKKWVESNVAYVEVEIFSELNQMQNMVLAGMTALFIDGEDKGILIDARTYPVRSPSEPELERVTRGSRDGFVETMIFNTALIRRRVRDSRLICEIKSVGKRSKTDVSVVYIKDLVDDSLLEDVKERIDNIQIEALIMGEKSLEEVLIKKKWFNPLPQVRFTERPDVTAAHLLEGHIAIIVDNSPSVMLLPTTMFHFTQHSEDYYQNPMVGTYIRWIRFLSMLMAFLLTPIWMLLVEPNGFSPDFLRFMIPKELGAVALPAQIILLELGLDILRMASIHTPSTLSTSLGIIGGLILSDLAVNAGYVIPESVFITAISGVCTLAMPSLEFSNAIRIFRLFLIITTATLGALGFAAGLIVILIILFKTRTFSGISYLWPLIPFDGTALKHILIRCPILQVKREHMKNNK